MNKSVLISIKPKYVELIVNGEKTIEIRKSAPKEVPFKAYIYETKGATEMPWVDEDGHFIYKDRGQVIGEFVCDKIEEFHEYELSPCKKFYEFEKARLDLFLKESCLSYNEVCDYRKNLLYYKPIYGWHISDLKIYDKPKELIEFRPICKFEGKDAICALFCLNWKYDGGLFFECTRKVTRPPHSYMYVEEV